MDKIFYLTLLYDFYGELLTDRQKEIFGLYYLNDLSMQEIGEQLNIKRQSVNDLLKRTEKILKDYENKLCLVKSHISNKEKIDIIISDMDNLIKSNLQIGAPELEKMKLQLLDISEN